MRYIVIIGNLIFTFEDPNEAVNFAKMAKITILDDTRDIMIKLVFEDELKEDEII